MGKEEGCWLQGRGAATCPGLGLSSQGLGRENNEGSPKPPLGVDAGASFLFPQACSFVCVFIGGSGEFFCLLLFPFFFSWFGLWLAPDLGSGVWRGSDASRVRLENYLKEWTGNWHGNGGSSGFCGESVQGGSFRAL